MKIFQMKVFIPVVATLLFLSLAVSAYKLGAFDGAKDAIVRFIAEQKLARENSNIPNSPSLEKESKKLFPISALAKPVFAKFEAVKDDFVANLSGEKVALADIANLSDFEKNKTFSAEQKKALAEDNFFLAANDMIGNQEGGLDDFNDIYNSFGGSLYDVYRQPQNSVFISSDYALHLYHILIDRSFQKIEESKLQPRLKEMTEVLFVDSLNNYRSTEDRLLKESYQRLAAYYLVPLAILKADAGQKTEELNPADFETFAQFEEAISKQNKSLSQEGPDILKSFNKICQENNFTWAEDEWIFGTVNAELKLIDEAKELSPSPLFSISRPEFLNDYTQFTPRSHYTKNKTLKTYFMAMMWYGRMGFVLKSPSQTRDALLITQQVGNLMMGEKKLSDQLAETMSLIDFFVGKTDDLTPYQYSEVMKKVFGDEMSDSQFASDEMIKAFKIEAGRSLPSPEILSEAIDLSVLGDKSKEELLADTMQFRFMGQRFTPDAYILNQFTQGAGKADDETGQKLPSMPTALMPISIIEPNNAVAKSYLDKWVESSAKDSDKIIAKTYSRLAAEMMSVPPQQWNENIYWSWLDCYRPLLKGYGQGYPYFMKSDAWQKKNLGTVLGSYAELKHDTLLYAKQSYAELGAGSPEGEIPPVPKGYVEADPVFWAKILSLAKATSKGLEERGYMPEQFAYKYGSFIENVSFFKDLSEKELRNEKISDEDFERLRIVSLGLENIVQPLGGEELELKDRRAGIIADIHTDAFSGQILYEATGKPLLIYVAINDINGSRLAAGAVFNHYEFAAPLGKRLSDEDWQAVVYEGEGQLPAQSAWSSELKK